ncbi:double-strand break repair helicase AddA [Phenylobacterium sp. J426]|uniref:double-strand break repair helicase AddA n=1 Tax=Phenylobacterium sp. J426 TaxID=2898439 RepID=UPI0021516AD0|nr:double-strand break repair helicase AddA [Phenylobacterium sp. J426]MCR5873625.1 double-strand break repair helicase AddA [Phenylobacterium sp. J426]
MTLHLVPTPQDHQRNAADPGVSAFVTANAGSGKTKTLIDRVARLLLTGAEPETILCVTYTKAAAAEMQRRLFARLGGWSVMPDGPLTEELADLEGRDGAAYDDRRLSEARALFARALETPGGLKIQTIHAFCEKLLRRFPLEAGISPGFRVMDDAASAAVAAAARAAVARHALKGEGRTAQAYARLSVALDFGSFQQMFLDFEGRRGKLRDFFEARGGHEGAAAWVWETCGLEPGEDAEAVERAALAGLDRNLWRAAAETLLAGTATDQKCAGQLRAVAAEPAFAGALAALFTDKGEGTPATWVAKTSGLKAQEGLRMALLSEQDRLAAAREKLRAARVAADTLDALTLAEAYLAAYRIEKTVAGALDFADLIEKTRSLLASRPAAAWVLYKLDGGIDHILVDEAQDTAPDQWEIVRALTGEFFAGDGMLRRSEAERTLFVVGDEKQSIYSFQGAAPERLLSETRRYVAEIEAAGRKGAAVPLHASWRSTEEVLSFVDAVFSTGVPPGVDALEHIPMRAGERGCVDLWPLVREPKSEARDAWDAPLDAQGEESAVKVLARNIACEIRALVERGDTVVERGRARPASWGDVLILVRKRGGLFEEILRALKHASIPVAGADRLALSEHIVFDDLMALARFALFPDDDLTLAALLKSPFCGLTDDDLFQLAWKREGRLWRALTTRADEQPAWRAAADFLATMRKAAAETGPFGFYTRALGARDAQGRSMRMRLLRRLGAEAEDALDEFLAQVLAAEGRGVHDLESLAADFASLDIVVKRELEGGRDEVRVMTAHGAKGLEAPVVILPETTSEQGARGSPLLETTDGGFLWCASGKADCEASAAARTLRQTREAEESLRLLYVALTRARERLILCGRIAANRKEEGLKAWWSAIKTGFAHERIAPQVRQAACGDVLAERYGPDPVAMGPAAHAGAAPADVPAWAGVDPAPEAFARYASPSDLGEGTVVAAPSPLAAAGGLGRFRRGDIIHRLLQVLPDLPPEDRASGARALLAREPDLSDDQRAEMATAALSVLEDARFAEVFGPGSRAEVAIAGSAAALPPDLKISGRIDRLVVLPGRVLVADFKTNRPSPDRIEDADPAYLRQMALYAAVLAEVFPGRRIEAALVWTDGPKLMTVPENLLARTLAELRRGG